MRWPESQISPSSVEKRTWLRKSASEGRAGGVWGMRKLSIKHRILATGLTRIPGLELLAQLMNCEPLHGVLDHLIMLHCSRH
jgi:hypothetical protein